MKGGKSPDKRPLAIRHGYSLPLKSVSRGEDANMSKTFRALISSVQNIVRPCKRTMLRNAVNWNSMALMVLTAFIFNMAGAVPSEFA